MGLFGADTKVTRKGLLARRLVLSKQLFLTLCAIVFLWEVAATVETGWGSGRGAGREIRRFNAVLAFCVTSLCVLASRAEASNSRECRGIVLTLILLGRDPFETDDFNGFPLVEADPFPKGVADSVVDRLG